MTTTENKNTNEHINRGSTPHESLVQGTVEESPATGIDSTNFNDSGFFDWEDDETNPYRHDYKDFVLFTGDIPIVSTDNFFADLDASANTNHGSVYAGLNESTSYAARGPVDGAQTEEYRRNTFYDPVHEAVQQSIAICKALNDFEIQSQPDHARPSHNAPIFNPLEKWANTFERHESIAYRLEQPSNPPRPLQQHSRQPSQRSGHECRSH
jgi:hypothetical protein